MVGLGGSLHRNTHGTKKKEKSGSRKETDRGSPFLEEDSDSISFEVFDAH